MAAYVALLRKDPDSDFGVDFPDFPGCITAGETLAEARSMAAEALAGHIAFMLEDGDPLPDPTPLETIMEDPFNDDAVPFLVEVTGVENNTVHLDVPMPKAELNAIDSYARDHGVTRSQFIREAAKRALIAR